MQRPEPKGELAHVNPFTLVVAVALLVPAAVLGYVLSRYANRVLTPARQRWTAIAASTAGAVVLVVQQTGLL